jgi:hypothetical protein
MTPTRGRLLLALLVIGAAVGWGTATLVDAWSGQSLPVPWTAPVVMGVLALALFLWARGVRARLAGRPGTTPMNPLVAARSAALAMAASRVGALVAGFYAGVAIALLPSWQVAYIRQLVLVCAGTVVLSGLFVLAGLFLERVCRIPPGSLDDPADDSEDATP